MNQALNKEHRWGSALLSRHQSLEEEFERAKAAVEVSTAAARHRHTPTPTHPHHHAITHRAQLTHSSGSSL